MKTKEYHHMDVAINPIWSDQFNDIINLLPIINSRMEQIKRQEKRDKDI